MLTTASWLQQRWAEAHPPRSEEETVRALASRLALARTAAGHVSEGPSPEADQALADVRAALRSLRTVARDRPALAAAEAWAALLDALPILARPPPPHPPQALVGHAAAPSGGEDLARQRARQAARMRETRYAAHERARGEALTALVDTLASLCDDPSRGEALLKTGALAWVLSLLGPGVQVPSEDGGVERASQSQYAPAVSLSALGLLRVLVHSVPEMTGAALLALGGGLASLLQVIAASEAQFEPDDEAAEGVHARAALRAEALLLLPSLVGHSAPLAQLALYEGALDVLLHFLSARAQARQQVDLPWDSDLDAFESCEAILTRASGARRYFSQAKLGTTLLPVLQAGGHVTAQPGLRLLQALLADPEPEPVGTTPGPSAAAEEHQLSTENPPADTSEAEKEQEKGRSEKETKLELQRHLAHTLLPWVTGLLFLQPLAVEVYAASIVSRCVEGSIEAQAAFVQTGSVPDLINSILTLGLSESKEEPRALWALHQAHLALLDSLVGTNVPLRKALVRGLFLRPLDPETQGNKVIDPLDPDVEAAYLAQCRTDQVHSIWLGVLRDQGEDAKALRACHLLARLVRGSNAVKQTLSSVRVPKLDKVLKKPSEHIAEHTAGDKGDAIGDNENFVENRGGAKGNDGSAVEHNGNAEGGNKDAMGNEEDIDVLSFQLSLLDTHAARTRVGVLALLSQWAWEADSFQFVRAGLRDRLTLLLDDGEDMVPPLAALALLLLPAPAQSNRDEGVPARERSRAQLLQVSTLLRAHPTFARVRPASLPRPGPLPGAYALTECPGCPEWAGEWFDWSFVLFYHGAVNTLSHGLPPAAHDEEDELAELRESVQRARQARSQAEEKRARAEIQLASLKEKLDNEIHLRAMGAQAAAKEIRRLRDEVGKLPPAPAPGTAAAVEESADEKEASSASEEEQEEQEEALVSPSPDPVLLERIDHLQAHLREATQVQEAERENEDLLVLLEELTTKRSAEKALLRSLGQEVSEDEDE